MDPLAAEKVKGVSYNHKSRLWGASWYENGKRIDKAFSVSRYGAVAARAKAIKWRRDRELGIPYEKPRSKGTCSQVRGVHFDQRNRQWKASWSINGRRFEKTFSVSKYGDEEAKSMAIQWRRDREAGLPYEKPKRTCEVRGVWYMRWSKTWVASWSENGKWVRKSFSVSKYGQKGARQRAIDCRAAHTKSKTTARSSTATRTRKSKAQSQSFVSYPSHPVSADTIRTVEPMLVAALDGGGTVPGTVPEMMPETAPEIKFPAPPLPGALPVPPPFPGSALSPPRPLFAPQGNTAYASPARYRSTVAHAQQYPVTPRSRSAILRGAKALVDMRKLQPEPVGILNVAMSGGVVCNGVVQVQHQQHQQYMQRQQRLQQEQGQHQRQEETETK